MKNIISAKTITWILKYKYLILFILSFALYFQVLFFGFVKLDDMAIIENKQEILSDYSNINQVFSSDAFLREKGSFYRPLQTLTFMMESNIIGANPWLYHLTNITIHSLNSLLLLWLLIVLGFEQKRSLMLSALFAVHPLFTHAVAWVPSRNDLMLVMFLIPSFVFFINFLKTKKIKYIIYHAVFFLLSVFTKETAMAFPGICAAYYLLIYRKKSVKRETMFGSSNMIAFGIWVLVLLFVLIVRIQTIGFSWTPEEFGISSLLKNILIVPEIFAKFIAPYDQPVLSNFDTITSIIGLIAIIGMIIWIILKKDRNTNMIIFALIWFLLFILPGSMYRHAYADYFYDYLDHRAYLPMIGIFIFLSSMLPSKVFDIKKVSVALIFILLLGGLSALSVRQSNHYKDPIRFWFKAIKDNPYKAGFYLSLGKSLIKEDKYKIAQKVLLRGINLMPHEKNFYLYLGEINFKLKEFDKSVKYLNQYLQINPMDVDILKNLGGAYANLYQYDKALEVWINSLSMFNDPEIKNGFLENIISLYQQQNNIEKAYEFSKMLKINPENRELYYNTVIRYSSYMLNKGNIPEAKSVINDAIKLMPDNWQGYYLLGNIHVANGNFKKAISYLEKAIELAPNAVEPYKSLYNIYTKYVLNKEKADYYKNKIEK